MSKGKDLYIVMDRGGRYYVGYVERDAPDNRTILMRNPLLFTERVMPTQDPSQQQIALNISPIMHTFGIDTWEFQWIGKHKVTDQKLIDAYEKFMDQIKASRLSVTPATVVPPGLANTLDPALARATQG